MNSTSSSLIQPKRICCGISVLCLSRRFRSYLIRLIRRNSNRPDKPCRVQIGSNKVHMQSTITGKAYVLGDNVDTDQIIPAQYLTFNPSIPEEYRMFGKYALSSVPPAQSGLPKGHVPFHTDDEFVSPFKIVIAGKNFGC